MFNFVKRQIFALLIAIGILSILVEISNLILKEPRLSQNDLHILWILSGEDYFVKSSSNSNSSNMLMETNKELYRLNSSKDFFLRYKEPGVFRIFCLGGSTTRGWPFNPRLSYPLLLSGYLQDLLPERKIEVINAGFCASDSSSDIGLVKEIMHYQPDLLLIYEGRNEELQLPFHIGFKSYLVKAHVWLLRNIYFYSFLKHSLLRNKNIEFNHAEDIREFLGQKFKGNEELLRDLLERNLLDMLKIKKQKDCSVVLLTQVLSKEEIQNKLVITKINDWLREFSLENNIALIDIDYAFRNSDIPDERLVIPVSVHPDLEGYVLMAKTVCRELSVQNIIAPEDEWKWGNIKSGSQYFKQINLTSDFLAEVYLERLGDFFKYKMDMPGLAKVYYKRGLQYLFDRNRVFWHG